jgi:hypothetical protein
MDTNPVFRTAIDRCYNGDNGFREEQTEGSSVSRPLRDKYNKQYIAPFSTYVLETQ